MWFKRDKPYDRFSTLAAADRAVAKGRLRKAIALYRKVLAIDPADHVTHGKMAPLLAKRRQRSEAWASFFAAREGYLSEYRLDKALSIYLQAVRCLPRQLEAWEGIAWLHCELRQPADAVMALLDGCRHFRGRKRRSQAIRLLRRIREIEPWHFEATFTLARLLTRTGEKAEAERLLNSLAVRMQGRKLRRVQGALFRMAPRAGTAWRWLCAAVSRGGVAIPRISRWQGLAAKSGTRRQPARAICLSISLVGTIAVGVPSGVDVGSQTIFFLLAGSGLAGVGLTSFLFFSR